MIAEPVKKDYIVPQGVTYPIRMRWVGADAQPIDLTGAQIRAQLKKQYTDTEPAIDCTLGNGKAFLDTDGWYFGFTLTAEDTNALAATTYVYDLLVILVGNTTRAMEGRISLSPGVTRE